MQMKARKEKDVMSKFLTLLISEIEAVGKNKRNGETTEEEAVDVVLKMKKNATATLNELLKSHLNEDKVEMVKSEIAILNKFVPKPLSTKEITAQIQQLKESNDAVNFGQVMKHFSTNFKGRFDASDVKKIFNTI